MKRLVVAAAVCAVGVGIYAQQEVRLPAPTLSGPGKPDTTYPTTAWPTNGGDLYNRRFSPLTQINRDNVAQLKGVWRTGLGESGLGVKYSGEAQPIVQDGVI